MVSSLSEKIARVARLRIKTMRLLRGILHGAHVVRDRSHSGLEFDTLRDYSSGDDVRHIDWKSTARGNKLIVRSYWESRDRTIVICLDLTASMRAGSSEVLKADIAQDIAILISCAAEAAHDSLGLVIYLGDRCLEVPARSGKEHYARIIDMILNAYQEKQCTYSVQQMAMRVQDISRKNALIILITDGILSEYEMALRMLSSRNLVAFIRVSDRYEHEMPAHVMLAVHDPESEIQVEINGRSMQLYGKKFFAHQDVILKQYGIRSVQVYAGESYDEAVRMLFMRGI